MKASGHLKELQAIVVHHYLLPAIRRKKIKEKKTITEKIAFENKNRLSDVQSKR